jgi:aryl-alcohol dehydrogenase-like predicted oxidoreductase
MLNKLSIGTAQFGMDYGINNKVGEVDQNEIKRILDFAYLNGINSLDTAKGYGQSEEKIGEYIKSNKFSWNITTKISDLNDSIENQILDSVKKSGCKSMNILAHSSKLFFNDSFFNQINNLRNDKIIKKVGLSVYPDDDFKKIFYHANYIDIIQLPLNILDTKLIKNGTLYKLSKLGIEIHARSVFLQGLLNAEKKRLKKDFIKILPPITALEKFISNHDINIAEYSLLFVSNLSFVNKVIIGVETLEQLCFNINSFKKKVKKSIYKDALSIEFDDDYILNPRLWN